MTLLTDIKRDGLINSIDSLSKMLKRKKTVLEQKQTELNLLTKRNSNEIFSGMLFWKKTVLDRMKELKSLIDFNQHQILTITTQIKENEKKLRGMK